MARDMAGNTDMRDNIYASTQNTLDADNYKYFENLPHLRENEFEWIVPNILELRNAQDTSESVLSTEFELGDGASSFQFQLFKNGAETKRSEASIGVFLRVNGCPVPWSFPDTQFHVAVINYNDWRRSIFRHGTFAFTHTDDNVGWPEFITLTQVATNQFWSPSGEMRIRGSVRLDRRMYGTPLSFLRAPSEFISTSLPFTDSHEMRQYDYANLKEHGTSILKLIADNEKLLKTIKLFERRHEEVVKEFENKLESNKKESEQVVEGLEEKVKQKKEELEGVKDNLAIAKETIRAQGEKLSTNQIALDQIRSTAQGSALEESPTCKICFVGKFETSFKPCGHAVACKNCVSAILDRGVKCPICNGKIESVENLIIS